MGPIQQLNMDENLSGGLLVYVQSRAQHKIRNLAFYGEFLSEVHPFTWLSGRITKTPVRMGLKLVQKL